MLTLIKILHNMTPNRKEELRKKTLNDIIVRKAVSLPKLKEGVDALDPKKDSYDSSKVAGISTAVGQVGGAAFDTFDKQQQGKTSVGGATLKGAASGASLGSVAGPWGAAIGGVVGGAAGAISSTMSNKKIDRDNAVNLAQKEQLQKNSKYSYLPNTQSAMYAEGTAMAKEDKLAEVEKDEIVLRKDVQGKFVKVADFSGGKSHAQGGEPYVVSQGDVIFPGHKRDLINSYLKNDNHSAIDGERQKLPKEMPKSDKLQDGIDRSKANRGQAIPKKELLGFDTGDYMGYKPKDKDNYVTPNKSTLEKSILPVKPIVPAMPKSTVKYNAAGVALPEVGSTLKPMDATRDSNIKVEPAADLKTSLNSKPNLSLRTESAIPLPAEPEKAAKPRGDWWSATDYAQPIGNVIRSLQKPEKTERRFVNPEEVQYKDQSAVSRRDNDIQAQVDKDNASRFSGGSAQVARAGKTVAGANKVMRGENINAVENSRADQILTGNVGIRNQAKVQNLELANRYDEQDLQNKAVLQAYGDRGLADLASVASQQRRDKGLEKSQDILLRSLATDNFEFTGSDGVIYKRAPGGSYINAKTAVPKPNGVSVTPKK